MKRFYFFSLCIAVSFFCSCNQPSKKTNLQLSESTLQMVVGDMEVLDVNVSEPVTWKSSNTAVATVSDGIVEAVGVGYANITAQLDASVAECLVYVTGKSGETLTLTPAIVTLDKGQNYQYDYSSTYDVPLTWTSSNPEIATVSDKGVVTALSGGNTFITLSDGMKTVTSRVAVNHTWGEYSQVWSEEFNGSVLDLNTWNIEVNGNGGGNKELQYYTDRAENLRLEDGCLIIQARKEEYNNRQYTSARINSRDKAYFKYGKVEARISFPSGAGTWPAFWMMGNDYSKVGWPKCGEIDIIEHIGRDPRMASFAVHTPYKNGTNGTNWSSRVYLDNLENNFHVYGIEWQQEEVSGLDRIIFTIDGVEYAASTELAEHVDENYYWPFNKDHFIILNLAIGGNMAGSVDDSIFDNDIIMKVDWVRVYQRAEK